MVEQTPNISIVPPETTQQHSNEQEQQETNHKTTPSLHIDTSKSKHDETSSSVSSPISQVPEISSMGITYAPYSTDELPSLPYTDAHIDIDVYRPPAKTNIFHSVHIASADNFKYKGGAVGFNQDQQAKKMKEMKRKYNVKTSQKLFNQLGAFFVPYRQSLESIVRHCCLQEMAQPITQKNDSFYLVDLSQYVRQYMQWNESLPRVKPFYAVKSNPSEQMVKVLGTIGCGFDCASMAELDLVVRTNPNIEVKSRVIYAHPCKPLSHIEFFKTKGAEMTVADNEDELLKLKEYWPNAKVFIRIKTDDQHSASPFSTKFGASEKEARRLIQKAKSIGYGNALHGISFHVGSRCYDVNAYRTALLTASRLIEFAKKLDITLKTVDIGGGWPGHDYDVPHFVDIAAGVRGVLDELFPEKSGITLMAEPGRYFSSAATTIVTSIVARRLHNRFYQEDFTQQINSGVLTPTMSSSNLESMNSSGNTVAPTTPTPPEEEKNKAKAKKSKEISSSITVKTSHQELLQQNKYDIEGADIVYYIHEGIYQSFNAIVFDHKVFNVSCMTQEDIRNSNLESNKKKHKVFKSVIFGITCDSIDCISWNIHLPKLKIGDYLWFPDAGSYTIAAASHFNGFYTSKTYYYWRN